MRTYIVTYKTPETGVVERRVAARNHTVAGTIVANELDCEIIDVRRDDDGEEDRGRRVGGPLGTSIRALLIGLSLALAGVLAYWFVRGCPKLW